MSSRHCSTSNERGWWTRRGRLGGRPRRLRHHICVGRKGLAALLALLALGAAGLAVVLVRGGSGAPGETPKQPYRDRKGDGVLERSGGEPLVDRTELAPRSRVVQRIARFAQLTDAPVGDEERAAR